MHWANHKFLYRSSIVLFFFACNEDENTSLTHPFDPKDLNIDYKLNLQSDSGVNLDSVTISWRQTNEDMIIKDENATETTVSGNSYTCCQPPFVGLTPGEFRDFSFRITIDDDTYENTIQIYTRNVHSVTNFTYNIQTRWKTNDIWDEGEYYEDGNNSYDLGEYYEDGNNSYDLGEAFTDSNNGKLDSWEEYADGNNSYDLGEAFTDCGVDSQENPICEDDANWKNIFGNGKWDEGEDYEDSNNGTWDPWENYEDGNGIWDEGEVYIDSDNDIWDPWENFTDSNNGTWDPWEDYEDGIEVYDRKLEWQVTAEPPETFLKYFIYRVPKTNAVDLLAPESCNCLIDSLSSLSVISYTDTDPLVLTEPEEQTFYYLLQVSTGKYMRNSFIHYNGFPQPEETTLYYVSTDKNEYIEIKWTPIPKSDYFYQYEILRTLGDPEKGNDTLVVAIIPNIETNHFMDRGGAFSGGTTFYYSIVVVDINNRRQSSNFVMGYSNP